MDWIELNVNTLSQAQEIITNILYEAGAQGLLIEDCIEPDLSKLDDYDMVFFDEPIMTQEDRYINIKGYFSDDVNLHDKISFINERIKDISKFCIKECPTTVSTTHVNDEDWAEQWKKYYKPIKVGNKVVIKPSWEKYEPEIEDLVITLDPGSAFGTGTHETTQLCIELLEEYLREDSIVIDVGCGTGVLSLACVKLGCIKVIAVDVDSLAVKATTENIKINNAQYKVNVLNSDLLDSVKDKSADVIVANIGENTIRRLAPLIKDYLNHDGVFIASGMVKGRVKEIEVMLDENHLIIKQVKTKNEWIAICCSLKC